MYIQRGVSALMMAARRDETVVVKDLVEAGADLNLQNKVCQLYMMYMYMNSCNVHVCTRLYLM